MKHLLVLFFFDACAAYRLHLLYLSVCSRLGAFGRFACLISGLGSTACTWWWELL